MINENVLFVKDIYEYTFVFACFYNNIYLFGKYPVLYTLSIAIHYDIIIYIKY